MSKNRMTVKNHRFAERYRKPGTIRKDADPERIWKRFQGSWPTLRAWWETQNKLLKVSSTELP